MTPAFHAFLLTPRCSVGLDGVPHLEGRYLRFTKSQFRVAHEDAYDVVSQRGLFSMGRIEWSPQVRAYQYKPHPEAALSLSVVAEVWAFIKSLGGRQV